MIYFVIEFVSCSSTPGHLFWSVFAQSFLDFTHPWMETVLHGPAFCRRDFKGKGPWAVIAQLEHFFSVVSKFLCPWGSKQSSVLNLPTQTYCMLTWHFLSFFFFSRQDWKLQGCILPKAASSCLLKACFFQGQYVRMGPSQPLFPWHTSVINMFKDISLFVFLDIAISIKDILQ